MPRRYQYTNLDPSTKQIRLLTILSSKNRNSDLHCTISTAPSSSEAPKYAALSYAWGEAVFPQRIFIGKRMLRVTQNLFDALVRLRNQSKPTVLWIDAICINQTSNNEKNHQVRLMRDIYHDANQVLIWLGKSTDELDKAMDYLRDRWNLGQVPYVAPTKGLFEYCELPWWSRMWVVQEVVAARIDPLILCGEKSIPYSAGSLELSGWLGDEWMAQVLDLGSSKDLDAGSRVIGPLNKMKQYLRWSIHRPSTVDEWKWLTLERLLLTTSSRESSDPRDRIYALLGIAHGPDHSLPDPNYSLDAYAPNIDFEKQTPSWCIDFSLKCWSGLAEVCLWATTFPLPGRDSHSGPAGRWCSSGKLTSEFSHGAQRSVLNATGARIGLINSSTQHHNLGILGDLVWYEYKKSMSRHFHSLAASGVDNEQPPGSSSSYLFSNARPEGVTRSIRCEAEIFRLFMIVDEFVRHAYPSLASRLGREKAVEKMARGVIWKIASKGMEFHEHPHAICGPTLDGYAQVEGRAVAYSQRRAEISTDWADFLPSDDLYNETLDLAVVSVASIACEGSCFVTTDTGYIGCAGPFLLQEGDVLAIIFGCNVPAVLRPQDDGTFKIVSFAYVDDVMEGQFVRNEESLVREVFSLS
ncbi:HET-domain-containing protein [Zalerion maritima]|uniref:HET-domain-containing protein n=1 Tax=Zalerion maritima TaxID=339359 RepID=A0AAD5WTM2_9PEZI|nr:HET-domain-containing protein [Zalerion maritima]